MGAHTETLAGRTALSCSAMLVAFAVVVCWRGWWHLMDAMAMQSWVSLLIGTLITLAHYWVRPMMPEWPQDSAKQVPAATCQGLCARPAQ